MNKPLVDRLEYLSDAILQQPSSNYLAASLLLWEAAQALRMHQQAREEIYVSTASRPDD